MLPDISNLSVDEINAIKFEVSMQALANCPASHWTLATDGGSMLGERSVGVAVLLNDRYSSTVLERCSQACGPLACSYRTESIALKLGLQQLIMPKIDSTPIDQLFTASHIRQSVFARRAQHRPSTATLRH